MVERDVKEPRISAFALPTRTRSAKLSPRGLCGWNLAAFVTREKHSPSSS
jgi:hypothetical protein